MADMDVEKLKQELKKRVEMRDSLLATTERMQKAVYESQISLKDVPNEENIWRERFTQQQSYNRQLQSELAQLEQKFDALKAQLEADGQCSEPAYEELSDSGMRQLLRQLEKEKTELEWQLKECEWRLDQEAAGRHKAEEEKKTLLTQLGHINHQTQGEPSRKQQE